MIKFSVVIPLYNKEKEIVDTINSVLNQSYAPDEIIVVDDGSTDNSRQIIENSFGNKIRLIYQKNKGETAARNRGIREAKNEYVALLDADDLWEKDFLLEIKGLIEDFKDAVFYSTSHKILDENGNFIKSKLNFNAEFRGLIEDFPKTFAKNYGLINSSSVCIRKSVFNKGIIFPEGEKRGGDLCYWLELSLIGKLAFSAKPLSIWRLNASNRSDKIHREAIIPCPIKWFHMNKLKIKQHNLYKSIRFFVYSNLIITVYGGFALNKDYDSIKAIINYLKKQNDRFYLILLPALYFPVGGLNIIKKVYRSLR